MIAPHHVALTTPAVRLVVLEVWVVDDSRYLRAEHQIVPVAALAAKVTTAGAEYVCLVVGPFGGIEEHDAIPLANGTRRLVACPWPESEDAERLKQAIDVMGRDLLVVAEEERLAP
jgi:hypothetical protein